MSGVVDIDQFVPAETPADALSMIRALAATARFLALQGHADLAVATVTRVAADRAPPRVIDGGNNTKADNGAANVVSLKRGR